MPDTAQKTVLIRDVDAEWYAEQLRVECPDYRYLTATDTETALPQVAEAEIIVALAPALSAPLIAAANRLEWILALTTGVDNLLAMPELSPCVTITNSNGFHGPQMSELAFLMMLGLNRNVSKLIANQNAATWERWPQRLLYGKTVGIVGIGAIAEDLASRCNAFGMTVIGVSDSRSSVPGFDRVFTRAELPAAAATSDFLVVLTPYDATTHHIIDRSVFAAMPTSAYLINLSRGGCVDEASLIEALTSGAIAGAGLDVFASEPLAQDDPIWSAPNVFITPHIGGMSDIYREQVLPLVIENLTAYARGGAARLRGKIKRD